MLNLINRARYILTHSFRYKTISKFDPSLKNVLETAPLVGQCQVISTV